MKRDPIILGNWRQMLEELKDSGYTLREISRSIGVSRTTLDRWIKSEYELPKYPLFSRMLFFYSHYIKKKNTFSS